LKGQEDEEEEDASRYWMALRGKKREYRKLKEEALWGTRFGKGYGLFTSQTWEGINVF
jgi:hypothetical protein